MFSRTIAQWVVDNINYIDEATLPLMAHLKNATADIVADILSLSLAV